MVNGNLTQHLSFIPLYGIFASLDRATIEVFFSKQSRAITAKETEEYRRVFTTGITINAESKSKDTFKEKFNG
jgi:hypothetical protein